jgi:hypothetical protein
VGEYFEELWAHWFVGHVLGGADRRRPYLDIDEGDSYQLGCLVGDALAHIELDYRREVRIEDRHLIGECRVASLGRSRVKLENRLVLADGEVAVEGRAVLVAWDENTRRSRELTENEREALLSRQA